MCRIKKTLYSRECVFLVIINDYSITLPCLVEIFNIALCLQYQSFTACGLHALRYTFQ